MAETEKVTLDRSAMAADLQKMVNAKNQPATEPAADPLLKAEAFVKSAMSGDVPPAAEPANIWNAALQEENPAVPAGEPDPEDITKPGEKQSGYQKLKAQNAELQNSLRGFQNQWQQMAKAVQDLQQQNQYLAQQMQQPQQSQQAVDPNDPLYKLTNELRPAFQKELEPFVQQLQQVQERNQRLEQALAERQRAAERARLREDYTTGTKAALDAVMFKDARVEDQDSQALLAKTVTLLALADKSTPEEAARKLRRTMLNWAQGFEKTRGAQAREKMQAGAKVPQPAPESTTRAEGSSPAPSISQLATMVDASGKRYANPLLWRMAGSPQLFQQK